MAQSPENSVAEGQGVDAAAEESLVHLPVPQAVGRGYQGGVHHVIQGGKEQDGQQGKQAVLPAESPSAAQGQQQTHGQQAEDRVEQDCQDVSRSSGQGQPAQARPDLLKGKGQGAGKPLGRGVSCQEEGQEEDSLQDQKGRERATVLVHIGTSKLLFFNNFYVEDITEIIVYQ